MAATLYLIYGNDEYMVSAKAKTVVSELVPPADQTLNLEIVDGAVDTVDAAVLCMKQCMAALQTMGLFSSERTIWLKNIAFLGDNRTGRSQTVKDAVAQLAALIKAGLPEGISLVISADTVDKRRAFFKACKAGGEIHEFSVAEKGYQVERQAGERLSQLLTKAELQMNQRVQTAFLGRIGFDTRQMVMEIEKLKLYLGDRTEATLDDVAAICAASRETASWDLADAFARKDLPEALTILRQLLFQRESPMGLLIGLENRIRELLTYREGLERQWLISRPGRGGREEATWVSAEPEVEIMFAEYMIRDPRKIHPFRVGVLAGQARKFTRRQLHTALTLAMQTHEKLVSSRLAPEAALELFLVRALSA